MGAAAIAGAVSGAVSGLGQIGFGIADRRQAKRTKRMPLDEWKKRMGFEDYDVDTGFLDEYKSQMGTLAHQQMPGYGTMREDVEATTAAGLGAVRQVAQGSDAYAGILGLVSDRQRQLRQLGVMASQYQAQGLQNYAQAGLQTGQLGAQYGMQEYEYNQWLPAQMKGNEVLALRGAGTQQMMSGLDQVAAAGVQGANLYQQQQWYDMMKGYYTPGGGSGVPPTGMQQIGQLGQQQVAPSVGLGADPYYKGNTNPFYND